VWEFLDKAFFQQLLITLVAVVLGIPAGIGLNRLWERRTSRQEREALEERRKQLREALKGAMVNNAHLLHDLKNISNGGIPKRTLDLALLDATAQVKYELLTDYVFCREIDSVRYGLASLSRQIDIAMHLACDGTARAAGNFVEGRKVSLYDQLMPQLLKTIQDDLDPLEAACNAIADRLIAETRGTRG
jgi:hypothetical protein